MVNHPTCKDEEPLTLARLSPEFEFSAARGRLAAACVGLVIEDHADWKGGWQRRQLQGRRA